MQTARLRGLADDVTALAAAVSSTSALDWSSVAADSFRARLAEEVARIRSTAGRIEDAAAAMSAHGARVDGLLPGIRPW